MAKFLSFFPVAFILFAIGFVVWGSSCLPSPNSPQVRVEWLGAGHNPITVIRHISGGEDPSQPNVTDYYDNEHNICVRKLHHTGSYSMGLYVVPCPVDLQDRLKNVETP
jgi:hypothetical protein